MIRRLLIANRGEIARRIIRACRELDIETVAVYSDADADAPHVSEADHAVRIGAAPARESYLNIDAIIARRAIDEGRRHPSRLRLSFRARAVRARVRRRRADLRRPAGVRAREDGIEDRRPGADDGRRRCRWCRAKRRPISPTRRLTAAAERVGFPVLIKPAAGGGGIGMKAVRDGRRVCRTRSRAARREAKASFGNDTLYVERLIERPRHVEIQVFADDARPHGAPVRARMLGATPASEGDRRESVRGAEPGGARADGRRRDRRGQARSAIATPARASSCSKASGDAARFYFLEMNTRLQVEHPVTECVAGVDLVHAQLRVASGEPLPFTQDEPVAARPRDRVPHLRRRSGAGIHAAGRHACCSIASRRVRAFASTAA